VRAARAFTSTRALRALVDAHAAEPASPPRPTLKRRADGTKGAAAPSLARADAPRQPRVRGASCAQRGRYGIEHLIRYAPLAVGLMEIKNINRYAPLAVGVNPSASQGEARLRGLYWT